MQNNDGKRQYPEPGGLQQGPDCNVLLSVIDMTQDKDNDDVTLFCASSCEKTVDWWWYVLVAVGLAALLITIVAVIRWKRAKGDRTHMDDRIAGPKEDVSYASVSYSKNNSSKAQVRTTTETNEKESGKERSDWWLYVVVAVGLAALLIIAVAVVGWRKSKETQIDDRIRLTSNPTVTQSVPKAVRTRRILKRRFSTPRSATQTPTVQPRFWLVKMK
ncbi:hypothetical protein PBY51_006455 [Eleginops maclovinus]|uniref:Transmembrane protein n=1 Tax=Eleginops maclovinus TaxID=56733 RepID=A0AAN7WVV9_ELEMC|nr:hypothetical protein PBY51_006455 [Eleginops maclovinus]